MAFWFGVDLGDLFFKGLNVHNALGMASTCCVFIILSIIYEGFKVLEMRIHRNNSQCRTTIASRYSEDRNTLLENSSNMEQSFRRQVTRGLSSYLNSCKFRTERVLMFTSKTSINYFIMLAVMLFNGYIFISIVIGMVLGHLIFGYIRSNYKMQAIRKKQKSPQTVGIPESESNDNNFSPPLLQAEDANVQTNSICEVQINTPNCNNAGSSFQNDSPDEPIVFSREVRSPRKTNDASKIKGSKGMDINNFNCENGPKFGDVEEENSSNEIQNDLSEKKP